MLSKKEIQDTYDSSLNKVTNWMLRQKELADTKEYLPAKEVNTVIHKISENLKNRISLIADLQRLNNLMFILRDQVDQSKNVEKKKQLMIIDNYTQKLDTLLTQYARLPNLIKLINEDGTGATLEQIIQKSTQELLLPASEKIMVSLADLTDEMSKINLIYSANASQLMKLESFEEERTSNVIKANGSMATQTRLFTDFTVMPAQNLPRTYMVMETLNDQFRNNFSDKKTPHLATNPLSNWLTLGEAGVKKAREYVQTWNDKKKSIAMAQDEFAQSSSHKIKTIETDQHMLRTILKLNINTPAQNKKSPAAQFFSEYLQTVLSKTYPGIFKLDEQERLQAVTSSNSQIHLAVNKAIGLDSTTASRLDPAKFDAKTLDELFQRKKNPLWTVLKSTIPVNKNFTAQQKIQTYAELVHLIKDKKLGSSGKYQEAYNLVQTAKSIAQEHHESSTTFNDVFGPNSTLGLWIIKKAKKADKEIVKSNLISTATQSSLDAEQSRLKSTELEDEETLSFNTTSLSDSQDSLTDSGIASDLDFSDVDEFSDDELIAEERVPEKKSVESQVVEKSTPVKGNSTLLENKKAILITQGVQRLAITPMEKEQLKERIFKAQTPAAFQVEENKVFAINKLSDAVKTITDNLSKSRNFFAISTAKKIDLIKENFKKLTLDEKAEIATYNPQTIQNKLNSKDNSNIGNFFKAINLSRSIISVSENTKSFQHFKKQFNQDVKENSAKVESSLDKELTPKPKF